MNFLKVLTAVLVMTIISFSASAQCSASSSCGNYTYEDCSSISVDEQTINGETTVTVTVDGVVVVEETCTSDNGGNDDGGDDNGGYGGFDFCAFFSSWGFSSPFCN